MESPRETVKSYVSYDVMPMFQRTTAASKAATSMGFDVSSVLKTLQANGSRERSVFARNSSRPIINYFNPQVLQQ